MRVSEIPSSAMASFNALVINKISKILHVNKSTIYYHYKKIKGKLKKDVTYNQIFRYLFPSGSVTGAPKIRSMEIINEIENTV